jgi:hypothetical protein
VANLCSSITMESGGVRGRALAAPALASLSPFARGMGELGKFVARYSSRPDV